MLILLLKFVWKVSLQLLLVLHIYQAIVTKSENFESSSTVRAARLLLVIRNEFLDALNAKPMLAREHAWFNHNAHADRAVLLHRWWPCYLIMSRRQHYFFWLKPIFGRWPLDVSARWWLSDAVLIFNIELRFFPLIFDRLCPTQDLGLPRWFLTESRFFVFFLHFEKLMKK